MNDKIKLFEMHLKEEEKVENTINKYLHDSAGTGEFYEPKSCMGELYEPHWRKNEKNIAN